MSLAFFCHGAQVLKFWRVYCLKRYIRPLFWAILRLFLTGMHLHSLIQTCPFSDTSTYPSSLHSGQCNRFSSNMPSS